MVFVSSAEEGTIERAKTPPAALRFFFYAAKRSVGIPNIGGGSSFPRFECFILQEKQKKSSLANDKCKNNHHLIYTERKKMFLQPSTPRNSTPTHTNFTRPMPYYTCHRRRCVPQDRETEKSTHRHKKKEKKTAAGADTHWRWSWRKNEIRGKRKRQKERTKDLHFTKNLNLQTHIFRGCQENEIDQDTIPTIHLESCTGCVLCMCVCVRACNTRYIHSLPLCSIFNQSDPATG